jgi:hypothetical protein
MPVISDIKTVMKYDVFSHLLEDWANEGTNGSRIAPSLLFIIELLHFNPLDSDYITLLLIHPLLCV